MLKCLLEPKANGAKTLVDINWQNTTWLGAEVYSYQEILFFSLNLMNQGNRTSNKFPAKVSFNDSQIEHDI